MKQTAYRFYCGLIDKDERVVLMEHYVEAMSKIHPEGFTVTRAMGVWSGCAELSVVIEVIMPAHNEALAKMIANVLRVKGNQSAVLVTIHDVAAFLMEGERQ